MPAIDAPRGANGGAGQMAQEILNVMRANGAGLAPPLNFPPVNQATKGNFGIVLLPCQTAPQPLGIDNCCGQVAIATVCDAFRCPASLEELRTNNPTGLFTSPSTITDFLNTRCGAQQHNGGSINDLCQQIDNGRPVIALVNANGTPHWITITGYSRDRFGAIREICVSDHCFALGGTIPMSVEQFEKIWSHPIQTPGVGNICRYDRLWIETGCKSRDLPIGPFSTATEDLAARCINNLTNGLANSSFSQISRGVFEFFPSLCSSIGGTAGRLLSTGSEALIEIGQNLKNRPSLLRRCLGYCSEGIGYVGLAVGETIDTISNAVATAGTFVGAAVERVASRIERGLNAVGDFFRSWF